VTVGIAVTTAPAWTAAQHQSQLHFVGIATWSDEEVLAKVHEMVLPAILDCISEGRLVSERRRNCGDGAKSARNSINSIAELSTLN
jgi:hypothetical protein